MATHKPYAHSGKNADRSDWQLLCDHHEAVSRLASDRAAWFGLSAAAACAGALHDFGKNDPLFDQVLLGKNIRVDHSTAGGWLAIERAAPKHGPAAEIIAYAILGHHAGLPDKQSAEKSCMNARLERFESSIDPTTIAATSFDLDQVAKELAQKFQGKHPAFNLSVAVRMLFSSLVDADFRDTEAFYDGLNELEKPRVWESLQDILSDLITKFDKWVDSLDANIPINLQRASILREIRAKAAMSPGLFTLTVPTGGGKTLASLGFALDHSKHHGHRRIIYAIPYTSITEQTANTFRGIFDDIVLEHHSSFEIKNVAPEQQEKIRLAAEDWAAPIVVTTNVQLFESLFAARPSAARKLHNIAGSVIILDEAQCLPRPLLLPTLRMIETLCTHYGCTIVLCTATQPAFDSRHLNEAGLALEGRELAPDPDGLARELRRARIVQAGEISDNDLVEALRGAPQAFVIVNSRAHALELFQAAQAAGLEGLVHLTTRQMPSDRSKIIEMIRERLKGDVPCRLIATSLIEAGVDLDFPIGWRAEAGLDSCVQAAGRVNRNGRRRLETSILTVFSAANRTLPPEMSQRAAAMRKISAKYDDLLQPAALRDWFEEVYWKEGLRLDAKQIMDKLTWASTGTSFAFREIANLYRMVETTMVPVIIATDDKSVTEIEKLSNPKESSSSIARALQNYIVQIPRQARELLLLNGKGEFMAQHLRGEQFFVLNDQSLYTPDIGLWWERADYLSQEQFLL